MGAHDESKLPDALGKRHKVITLSEGGSLVIARWTLSKTMIMAGWLAEAIKDLGMLDTKQMADADPLEVAKTFVLKLGSKLPEFLGLAVDPVDRATVMDLPADDALEVMEAVIDLNLTEKFLGKVKGLLGRFKSSLPAVGNKNT